VGSLGPNICEDHSFAQKLGSPAQVADNVKEELLIWYFLSRFLSSLAGRWPDGSSVTYVIGRK